MKKNSPLSSWSVVTRKLFFYVLLTDRLLFTLVISFQLFAKLVVVDMASLMTFVIFSDKPAWPGFFLAELSYGTETFSNMNNRLLRTELLFLPVVFKSFFLFFLFSFFIFLLLFSYFLFEALWNYHSLFFISNYVLNVIK